MRSEDRRAPVHKGGLAPTQCSGDGDWGGGGDPREEEEEEEEGSRKSSVEASFSIPARALGGEGGVEMPMTRGGNGGERGEREERLDKLCATQTSRGGGKLCGCEWCKRSCS